MFGKDGITSVDTVVGVDDCFFFFVYGSEQKLAPWREDFRHAEGMEKRRALDLRCGGAHFRAMLHE